MSKRCPTCKKSFSPRETGRPSVYCSAACRQKGYRKRAKERPTLKLFLSDLYQIRDQTARAKAAVKVLEELGYAVSLSRTHHQAKKKPRFDPRLSIVPGNKDKPES